MSSSSALELGDGTADGGRPARPSARPGRIFAWVLVALWLTTIAATVASGERTTSMDRLQDAVDRGDVDEVGVAGELGRGTRGSSVVQLRWREHGIRYVTEVHQRRNARGVWTGGERGDVATLLAGDGGAVDVERQAFTSPSFTATFLGWRVAGWLVWPLLGAFVLTLAMLVNAAEPARATRWAWFWLIFAIAPIFGPAYLLLGGPTGLARPARSAGRLTGGWAFLLCIALSSLNRA